VRESDQVDFGPPFFVLRLRRLKQ